jgi:hypothetical protein
MDSLDGGIVFYCFPKIENCFITTKFFAKILSEKNPPPPRQHPKDYRGGNLDYDK